MNPVSISVLGLGKAQSRLCGSFVVEQTFGWLVRHVLVSLLFMTACFIMGVLFFFRLCVACHVYIGWCPLLPPQTLYGGAPIAVLPRMLCPGALVVNPCSLSEPILFSRYQRYFATGHGISVSFSGLCASKYVSCNLDTSWDIRPGLPASYPRAYPDVIPPKNLEAKFITMKLDRNNLLYFLETLFGQSGEVILPAKCFPC